jgi:triphosphatase
MQAAIRLNSIVAGRSLIAAPQDGQIRRESTLAREIELKFIVNEATFESLQHSALFGTSVGRAVARRLHSIYFDTEAGDLRQHRIVLRMRRLRARHVLTLKWDGNIGGGAFERGEIEVPAPSPVPDPALLGDEVQAEILRVTEGRPLQPFFATDIKRVVRRIIVGGSEIEAAFDSGFIVFGAQRAPVREIELELKAGDPTDLYQFGLSLVDDFPMSLGIMTKAERGVLLSSGAYATAVRAADLVLAEQTVDQAIQTIISTCMAQFVANWPAFEGPDKIEAIHQMRVAMRRLRAALALFNRLFPSAQFRGVRAEAKRIASAMGEARNWDVFDGLLNDGPRSAFATEVGFEALRADAAERREVCYATVAGLLTHADTTRFVLSVEAFVARRGWRNTATGDELLRLTEPASGFAAECLERLHRRVRKLGKGLLDLPPEERHAVRIALKNLRYTTEFFGELFGHGGAVRSYTRAAARLQDALGNFNDMVMATDLARQLDTGEVETARAAGIILGWYGRGARINDADLHDAWRRFRKVKPFWTQAWGHSRAGSDLVAVSG